MPLWSARGPEPHVAEQLLTQMLERGGVDVRLGEPLTGVARAGGGIGALETAGATYEARAFVDAGYEGDLMAAAGVGYAVGREARDLHGESWAGRQPAARPGRHNFPVLLSPFAGDGSLLPEIREPELDARGWPAERLGEADGGLQPTASVSASPTGPRIACRSKHRPATTRPLRAAAPLSRGGRGQPRRRRLMDLVPDLLPHGKCDVNSIGPFSLNVLDGSNRGYIRDGRRMRGTYVLNEAHLLDARPQRDVVALGSYNIDAFGSVRMEPTLMLLGHAAGAAGAQCARRDVDVPDVEVGALQDSLAAGGQVLSAP